MIVWDGSRCLEGFCLAGPLPPDIPVPEADPEGGSDVELGPELLISVFEGRVTEITVRETLFFEGEQLIGQRLWDVAELLFENESELEELVLPNGSMLGILSGRRRDFALQLWATDEVLTSVHLQDFDWIED